MRNRLPWFLLAASLALNLFFVAGFFYPHLMGYGPPHREDPVAAAAREFSLEDSQVEALEALRARVAERRNERRGEREGFQAIIVGALRQPSFDRAALAEALDQRREASGDMILDTTEDLHGFLATLSPDQKAAFVERASRQREFLRHLLFARPPRRG